MKKSPKKLTRHLRKNKMVLSLWDWSRLYENSPEFNRRIVDVFVEETNKIEQIREHRDFIEDSQNKHHLIYGHGHKCLSYLWKLLIDEMPEQFKFLEIGVYKGQILSLVQMLSDISNKRPTIVGITPLFDPPFANYDRLPYIQKLYDQFGLTFKNTTILDGLSQDVNKIKEAKALGPYDMIYIDGDHTYESTLLDIQNYCPMIKKNGYLIIDDCSNFKNFPEGLYAGLLDVTKAVKDSLDTDKKYSIFNELLTCMHVRVWHKEK